MTTTLKYVGKKSVFVGKTLWEIIGNLKDFGVGRIIIRNSQATRYSEPCYLRVLEVKAQPNEIPPKVKVMRPANDLRDKDVSTHHSFYDSIDFLLINHFPETTTS